MDKAEAGGACREGGWASSLDWPRGQEGGGMPEEGLQGIDHGGPQQLW